MKNQKTGRYIFITRASCRGLTSQNNSALDVSTKPLSYSQNSNVYTDNVDMRDCLP